MERRQRFTQQGCIKKQFVQRQRLPSLDRVDKKAFYPKSKMTNIGNTFLSSQEQQEQEWRIWHGLWQSNGRRKGCCCLFLALHICFKTTIFCCNCFTPLLRWGCVVWHLAPPSTLPQRRPTMATPLPLLKWLDQGFLQSAWEPPWRLAHRLNPMLN